MRRGRSARILEKNIRDKLEELGFETSTVSMRDGFTMFMVEKGQKRLLVWIRCSPITEKAINLYKKITGKYVVSGYLTLKFYEPSDYIPLPGQLNAIKVNSIEDALKKILEVLSK